MSQATNESRDVGSFGSPIEIAAQYPSVRESTYFAEYLGRLTANRDMHTIVTGEGETGVGKSTLAASVCLLLDWYGWTANNATLDPREYAAKYDDPDRYPPGSWLLGDEWEQAMDSRVSNSKENRELSHNYAGKRYRQLFSCVTLPSKGWLDKRLGDSSADYWIQCLEGNAGKPKGVARVYRLKEKEHYESSVTKKTETIRWPVLDDHPEVRELHRLKQQRFEGTDRSAWIHRDEFEEAKKNFWNKATKKTRYELIRGMSKFGLSDQKISDVLELTNEVDSLSRRRVNDLVNADSFDEVYKS